MERMEIFFTCALLTLNCSLLVVGSGFPGLKKAVNDIDAWLPTDAGLAVLERKCSISYIPALENQASTIADLLKDKNQTSPKFRNGSNLNVFFIHERVYKKQQDPQNYNEKAGDNGDLKNFKIPAKDYGNVDEVAAAIIGNPIDPNNFFIESIKESGWTKIGGVVKDHGDYFVMVLALQVNLWQPDYQTKIPQISLE